MSLLDTINEAIATGDDDLIERTISNYKGVLDEIVYIHRWCYTTRLVLTDGTDFVEVHYDTPSTECQESELNAVARQVHPVEKTVTVYV